MLHPTQTQKFVFQPATWSYILLATDLTFLSPNHAAVWEEFLLKLKITSAQPSTILQSSFQCPISCGSQDSQDDHKLSNGNWGGRYFLQCQRSASFQSDPSRNGPPPTTYSYGGGQWNSDWFPQKNNEAKEEQSNWYEILLGQIQGESKPILDLLKTRWK